MVAAIGAVAIFLVNRDPAPDDAMPVTEDEADQISPLNRRRPALLFSWRRASTYRMTRLDHRFANEERAAP